MEVEGFVIVAPFLGRLDGSLEYDPRSVIVAPRIRRIPEQIMRLAAPEEKPAAVEDSTPLEQPRTCRLSRRQRLERPPAEQGKLHSVDEDLRAEIDTHRDAIDRCLETIECALPLDE